MCDYEVGYFSNRRKPAPYGVFEDRTTRILKSETDANAQPKESEVLIYRSGELILPVEVLIRFEDNSERVEHWDGEDRSCTFYYDKYIKEVVIDPEEKLYLDKNWNNNSRLATPETTGLRKYVNKFMFWVQNAMQTISFLV